MIERNSASEITRTVFVVGYGRGLAPKHPDIVETSQGSARIRCVFEETQDKFFETLVTQDADLILLWSGMPDWRETLEGLGGIRTDLPLYLLEDAAVAESAPSFRDGLRVAWLVDGEIPILPFLIEAAIELAGVRKAHRKEKDALIRQLLDLQDEQERIEAQAAAAVGLAEQLEFSKQSLQKLSNEKDKLFSIVAHDLKSPFTSILGYTELLASTAPSLAPDQIKTYAENAHTAAETVFRMMQTLLEWARVQIGRVEFNPERIAIGDIAATVGEVYIGIAKRKAITIRIPETPLLVIADRGMIESVLRNLMNNAIKFTHRGGLVSLTIDEDGGEVRVTIADNGVGMSPEQVADFNNGLLIQGAEGTGGESGTGLGLSICQEMIAKNGGALVLRSEKGRGSAFSFNLPRADA